MLTQTAITDFKDFLDDIIAYAVVTVNGTQKQIPIHRRERLSDGRVAVYLNIAPQLGTTATIQKVQLYNKNSLLWADKAENIQLSNVSEGALYRFVFNFTEQEV